MENHQDCCLRRVRISIYSKDLTIAIEFTKHEYAWMDREGGAVNATTASTRDGGGTAATSTAAAWPASKDSEIDDLTNRFERLGGS
ncbi:hypothetical protein E4U27_007421 [Claviceps purpurea]|nr:hypothetical protein E4U27_007421 [Claviceps purpurea]